MWAISRLLWRRELNFSHFLKISFLCLHTTKKSFLRKVNRKSQVHKHFSVDTIPFWAIAMIRSWSARKAEHQKSRKGMENDRTWLLAAYILIGWLGRFSIFAVVLSLSKHYENAMLCVCPIPSLFVNLLVSARERRKQFLESLKSIEQSSIPVFVAVYNLF